jgi:medium-chain acyl-[acyl-carrier-protein] hydrolase
MRLTLNRWFTALWHSTRCKRAGWAAYFGRVSGLDRARALRHHRGPMETPWFKPLRQRPAPRLRLFCWPYSGGSPPVFRTWPDRLPEDVEVWAAQLPGHPPRLSEPPVTRADAIADAASEALAPLLDLPFAFFGHSLGAMLAYEVARRLQARALPQPDVLVAAGHAAPHRPRPEPPIHRLPDDAFAEAVQRYDGIPAWVLEHREMLELVLPILRADFEVYETYTHGGGPRLRCPVAVFGGLQDPWTPRPDLDAWCELTEAACRVHMFPGDHFFIHSAEPSVLWAVAQLLAPQ